MWIDQLSKPETIILAVAVGGILYSIMKLRGKGFTMVRE
ncbi:hypothetical protein LCGC14_1541870 [marine sediment metagenome]|uniref:Uncharacterized protein n=1 Tax=marine sediment metagenome TaxID=412755 RepID=A0A0F9ISU8_9ZZZZ